jgi:hypothetical protein
LTSARLHGNLFAMTVPSSKELEAEVANLDPEWLEGELLKRLESPVQPWEAMEFDALRERLRKEFGK